jgi:hypothetical protein
MLRLWWGWCLFVSLLVCSAPSAWADDAGVLREIRVCVRPPNIPADVGRWTYAPGGGTVLTGSQVVFRQKSRGHAIYVLDPNARPESVQLLPIPFNKLQCAPRALPLPASVLPLKSPAPPPPAGGQTQGEAPKAAQKPPAATAQGGAPPPLPQPIARAPPPPEQAQPKQRDSATWPTSVLPLRGAKKTAAEKAAEELAYAGAIANQQFNEDTKRPDGKRYGIVGGTNPDGPNHPAAQAAAGAVLVVAGVLSAGAFEKKLKDALKKKTSLLLMGAAKESEKLAEALLKSRWAGHLADALNKNGAIWEYSVMKKFTGKLGGQWQAHHILEEGMMKKFRLGNPDLAPSVILTAAEHKAITAKLSAQTPKAKTAPELWKAYQDAYVDHPNWLKAIESYFVKGK